MRVHDKLRTPRLLLRPFRSEDADAFAAMNADPEVMRYFPAPLSRAESEALRDKVEAVRRAHGVSFCAVERRDDSAFVGMIGCAPVLFDAPFVRTHEPSSVIEVGWRLRREMWGHGYATEGAAAALRALAAAGDARDIVSFTVPRNARSRAVMERLGMQHCPAEDFDHPHVPLGHPLRRHVLYRRQPAASDPRRRGQ